MRRQGTSADQVRFATVPSKEKLLDSLVTAPQTAEGAAAPAPEVVRGVALAALAILGRTGDGMEAQYEALLHDATSADCLKMSKLNLNQCLAVAGPNYEDVYCTGRLAVSDTGACIAACRRRLRARLWTSPRRPACSRPTWSAPNRPRPTARRPRPPSERR